MEESKEAYPSEQSPRQLVEKVDGSSITWVAAMLSKTPPTVLRSSCELDLNHLLKLRDVRGGNHQ